MVVETTGTRVDLSPLSAGEERMGEHQGMANGDEIGDSVGPDYLRLAFAAQRRRLNSLEDTLRSSKSVTIDLRGVTGGRGHEPVLRV